MTELNFSKRLSRFHFIDMFEQRLVMRFHNWVDVCSSIDKQSLADILHSERGLVIYVQFVETLRNYFIQILIKQLRDPRHRILKRDALNIILLKEVSDSARLVLSEFLNQALAQVLNRNLKGVLAWMLILPGGHRLCIKGNQAVFQTVDCFAFILIASVPAHYLIDAVCHVKFVQIATIFSHIGLIQGRLIECYLLVIVSLLRLYGHLNELHLEQVLNRASLLRLDLHGAQTELFQLLRYVEPDGLLKVEKLLVPLVSYSAGYEKVDDGPDGPDVAFWCHFVLAYLWSQKNAIDA